MTEDTFVQVAYDDRCVYVAVTALDADAASIAAGLSRRDEMPQTDLVAISFDPRHDHLTGYMFITNPSGWQSDSSFFDDTNQDRGYNAVWDVRTTLTDAGWTAEYRVPFSQMRFSASPEAQQVWGFTIHRQIRRRSELGAWVARPRGERGEVSFFGHLVFDDRLPTPGRLELTPYVAARSENVPHHASVGGAATGLDVRMGVGTGATLSATFNPDFGQVEQDPAVLNLSVFETFFPEKRPFFLEDNRTFIPNGGQFQLFHSRRIGRARHRISFEGYIYEGGEVGDRFTAAFESAARRGVDVRLVLDSVGARIDPDDVERLERAGCRIGWFNRVRGPALEEVNYRTHRKALVVDGDTAFVGGIGIADQWARDTAQDRRWRDTHVEVRGPAAITIEAAFHENWIETGGIVEPDVLPHDRQPNGSAKSIVVWSSPEGGTNAMKLLYLLALAAARRSIDIQSPYLITDESTGWSLGEASRRGVRLRFLVEGDITDAKPVKFAGRADYERFLEQGIEVYEYQPAMMHAKAIVIDGILSILGSANFDNRSLELNDELNVAIFGRQVAARLRADFERDLTASTKLNLDAWRARPVHIRGREKLWSWFGEVF